MIMKEEFLEDNEGKVCEAPFLSIIVLAYQVESYLEQCLNSIISQSFADFELLLIDDGSTDRTASICDSFSARDSRIRVIHQPNRGIVHARKTGISHARGSYIATVDGDDWVEKDMYEILCQKARETNADIVQCNAIGNYPRRRVRLEVAGLKAGVYQGEEYRLKRGALEHTGSIKLSFCNVFYIWQFFC